MKGSLPIAVILFFACNAPEQQAGQKTNENTEIENTEAVKAPNSDKAAVRTVSELAAFMRNMHSELKVARQFVKDSVVIPDTVWLDFAKVVEMESTAGMIKDQDHFNGYAQLFLQRVKELKDDPSVEAYNAVISNCVSCHQNYCMGPIIKIKKLEIN